MVFSLASRAAVPGLGWRSGAPQAVVMNRLFLDGRLFCAQISERQNKNAALQKISAIPTRRVLPGN
jgi:TATA-box binding protein (TBP) (component of TFIID and TFIIIB)